MSLVSSRTDFNPSQSATLEDESRRITCPGPSNILRCAMVVRTGIVFLKSSFYDLNNLFGIPVMAGSRGGLGRFDQEATGHSQHTYVQWSESDLRQVGVI